MKAAHPVSSGLCRRSFITAGAAGIGWLLQGCGEPRRTGSGTVRITATTGMVAEVGARVGGDAVAVQALMGPGVDPHLYKVSESDLARLSEAELILYNGLNLEGKMADVLSRMGGSGRRAVAIAESIPADQLREPPEFKGHPDPHVWFDVALWRQTLAPAMEALAALRPESKSLFEQNMRAYDTELDELDRYCRAELARIPRGRRLLVTAHDAFGYFGRAYDVEVMGLQGISTLSEYSLRDVEKLVEIIVSRRVKAVFVESSVASRSIEAVAAGCKARGHQVRIGGTLFSDAMGAAGSPEGTYAGMVRHNVRTIVEALA